LRRAGVAQGPLRRRWRPRRPGDPPGGGGRSGSAEQRGISQSDSDLADRRREISGAWGDERVPPPEQREEHHRAELSRHEGSARRDLCEPATETSVRGSPPLRLLAGRPASVPAAVKSTGRSGVTNSSTGEAAIAGPGIAAVTAIAVAAHAHVAQIREV